MELKIKKKFKFRHLIEQLYTYGNKIEFFFRKKVDGWEAYGNEVEAANSSVIKVA